MTPERPVVAFRCDGNTKTGMGHVTECLSLAQSLTRIGEAGIWFATERDSPGSAAIAAAGYPCELLDPGRDDLPQLAAALERRRTDLLAADHSGKDRSYYRSLRRLGPRTAAIFDDGLDHTDDADLVVDYSVLASEAAGPSGTEYLIGPKYCLQSEDLHQIWLTPRPPVHPCRRLLVNQGGSDPFHLTTRILRAMSALQSAPETVVVLGPAVEPGLIDEVEALRAKAPFACQVERALSPARFLTLMQECDAAITAAGNTLYELSVSGTPSLIISHHERHDRVARAFARLGAASNLGIGRDLSEEAMAAGIERFLADGPGRATLAQAARRVVDGLGCRRTAERLAALAARPPRRA